MEDQGRGASSITALVEGYLAGWFQDDAGPTGPVPNQDGAWRVRSALVLLDQRFPEHLFHQVLWCSEKDARELIDAIRRHLPDAEAVRAFLRRASAKTSKAAKDEEDSSLSLDSEDVKQALNMLEYWTDHWLQEYQGKDAASQPLQYGQTTSPRPR